MRSPRLTPRLALPLCGIATFLLEARATLPAPAKRPSAAKGPRTSVAVARFNAGAVVSGPDGLGDSNPLALFLSAEGGNVPALQP